MHATPDFVNVATAVLLDTHSRNAGGAVVLPPAMLTVKTRVSLTARLALTGVSATTTGVRTEQPPGPTGHVAGSS